MSDSSSRGKSHHGCVHCKRRKIKCDEARPACSNCIKRSKACEYNSLPIVASHWKPPVTQKTVEIVLRTPPDTTDPLSLSSSGSSQTFEVADRTPDWNYSTPDTSLPPLRLSFSPSNLADFELFQNYTHRVCYTLGNAEWEEILWRDTISGIAVQHPFLLHGLLSLSALHIAYDRSNSSDQNRYISLATNHYASALSLYQLELSSITSENSNAIFVASCVIVVVSFAFSRTRATDPITEFLNCTTLFKGVTMVLSKSLKWILEGPLAGMLHIDLWQVDSNVMDPGEETALQLLSKKIDSSTDKDIYVKEGRYSGVMATLQRMFRQCVVVPNNRGLITRWMVEMDNKFLAPLEERTEIAMAILAVYGVALHNLNDSWWAGGMGKALILAVEPHLGPEDDALMSWVKERVGLTNTQETEMG